MGELLGLGDIGRHKNGMTAGVIDFAHRLGERFFASRGEHDFGTLVGGRAGRGQADAARRAGYHNDLFIQRLQ